MYAPRPSSKIPIFRACFALNRTTRSSCLCATADRNLISRTSLTRVRRAKSALTRYNPVACICSEKCIWHEFRLRRRSISSKDKLARIDAHSKSEELCEVPTREIADLAVAFYARIMQQECNKTAGALINKYT